MDLKWTRLEEIKIYCSPKIKIRI